MSKNDEFKKIQSELRENVPDISGVMIASNEGLSISTDFPEDDAVRVAAVSAAASGLGTRISTNAALGEPEEIMVKGKEGLMLIYLAGEKGVLSIRASARGNLGLVRLEASSAAKEVTRILNM
ncbi:MAG: roadblock/LC7 domain-containing protein [Thiotrichales bacterium]